MLDLRKISGISDFVVIAGGSSERQISAISRGLIDSIKERPIGVEGISGSRWVVVDYGDIIVHVIHDELRAYYNLEGLWSDAKELIVENNNP